MKHGLSQSTCEAIIQEMHGAMSDPEYPVEGRDALAAYACRVAYRDYQVDIRYSEGLKLADMARSPACQYHGR